MAETDTAVIEPVTADAVPDTGAVVEETLADTATDAPDTEGEEAPDTEVEQPKGLTEEEVSARIKAEREAWEAELRTTYEEQVRQQAAQERRTKAHEIRTGATAKRLQDVVAWAYKQGEEGHDFRFDPRSIGAIAQDMEAAVFQDQSDQWAGAFSTYLSRRFGGFKVSQQTAHRLAAGFRDWAPAQVVEAQFDAMAEAVWADMSSRLKPELEKQVRAELGAASKTAAMKNNDAARAGQPKPTGVGATGASAPQNHRAVLESPTATLAEKERAYKALRGHAFGS